MLSSLRLIASLCLALGLLSACSSNPTGGSVGQLPPQSSASIEQLLQQAADSSPQKAAELRLAAANQALGDQDFSRAKGILSQVFQAELPPAQQIYAATLNAEIALHEHNFRGALEALNVAAIQRLDELPVAQQIRTHLAHAQAFAGNRQTLEAARERTFLAPLLSGQQAKANQEAIWQLVSELPPQQLQTTGETDLDGWLALSAALRNANTLPQQQQAIESWIASHSQHPAAAQLPAQLEQLRHLTSRPLNKIALLLPQDGPLSGIAQALRDGFISARFINSDQGPTPEIQFYDSNRIGSLDSFYSKAKADGVQLVVGPLEKNLVRQLGQRQQLPITTLALNYADTSSAPPQLFQYGLAPEDEARDAAERATADGKHSALVIVPASDWGSRVLSAFQQSWQASGGKILGVERINNLEDIGREIGQLLQSGSQPQGRRQDVDFVFLAATPQQARLIKPVLDYQKASDLPVYATSNLYSGTPDPSQDSDLDGILFCDTPWLFNTNDPIRQQIVQQWPQANGGLGRLYAMGADAFRLSQRLTQMQAVPGSGFDGLSGTLSMTGNRRIQRNLPWAQFRGGLAQPLSLPAY